MKKTILIIVLSSIVFIGYSQPSVTCTAKAGKKIEIVFKNTTVYEMGVNNISTATDIPCLTFEMLDAAGNILDSYQTDMGAHKDMGNVTRWYILKPREEKKRVFKINAMTNSIDLVKTVRIKVYFHYSSSETINGNYYDTSTVITLIE